MGKVIHLAKIFLIVSFGSIFFGCTSGDGVVLIEEPTKLYGELPSSGPPKEDQVISVLEKGETGEIIAEQYSKDFKYYKIKLKDGRKGYVWVGDNFKVMPKK